MKLTDKYYSGREVQRMLGITEPSLRNLVNQKRLRKVIPPGRKTGLYLKTDVDTFAAKWEAFLMAKELPKATFGVSKVEDMEAENELAKKTNIAGAEMTASVRQSWLAIVPEGDYHVRYNNQIVAFLRVLPLKHEYIDPFMDREILERELSPKHIETLVSGKSVEMFVIGITSEPDVSETTRTHYMFVLLRGLAHELEKLGHSGVIITKVYAKTSSPTGIAMATHIGMQEYAPRAGKTLKLILDVEKSDSYLIRMYKKGLAEWKQGQETPRGKKDKKPVLPNV
jgi:hypothetical protein